MYVSVKLKKDHQNNTYTYGYAHIYILRVQKCTKKFSERFQMETF